MTQITLSGRTIPDMALVVEREVHARHLDGTLWPRIDLGRFFRQRRLEVE